MAEFQLKRLEILEQALLDHHDNGKRFNLNLWYDKDIFINTQTKELWCGTAYCAMGLACTVPELVADGLSISKFGQPEYNNLTSGTNHLGFNAARKFFGITMDAVECLFDARCYPDELRYGDTGAKAVAERIAELIADQMENGNTDKFEDKYYGKKYLQEDKTKRFLSRLDWNRLVRYGEIKSDFIPNPDGTYY